MSIEHLVSFSAVCLIPFLDTDGIVEVEVAVDATLAAL
jgi:hypothetical protein